MGSPEMLRRVFRSTDDPAPFTVSRLSSSLRRREALLEDIAALHRAHGDLVRVKSRGIVCNYICGPELVQEVMSRTADFPKSVAGGVVDGRTALLRRTMGMGLATAHDEDETWHVARHILTPVLTARAIKQHIPGILEVADEWIDRLRAEREPLFHPVEWCERLAFDIMTHLVFRVRFSSGSHGEPPPLFEALARVLTDTWRSSTWLLPRALHLSAVLERRRADAILAETLDSIVRERRAALALGGAPAGDILHTMLAGRDSATGKSLSDENIRHQLVTFLAASVETTAGTLSYALYELALHPDLADRVAGEADKALDPTSAAPLHERVRGLDLTHRLLQEVLRLHPPGPTIFRHVARDTVLSDRHALRANEKIAVFVPALHRHPRHWDVPDVFDPDRFLPAGVAGRHPCAFLPFGGGARRCIGAPFAMVETPLIVARLCQRFRLRLADTSYVLRHVYTDSLKPAGLGLRLRPRGS